MVGSADGCGCAALGLPRSSPSQDSISRSGAGGGAVRLERATAVALFTAFFTTFLATANRVVGASLAGTA